MKRFFLSIVIAICSVMAWGQALSVVQIGNTILNKNNFAAAKQVFNSNGLYIDNTVPSASSTNAVCMIGDDDYTTLMGNIKAYPSKKIKEVSFMIGGYYQDNLLSDLTNLGYKCSNKRLEYVTLGNGARVPQSTYSNGSKRCKVRELDNGFVQVLFVLQATSNGNKKK